MYACTNTHKQTNMLTNCDNKRCEEWSRYIGWHHFTVAGWNVAVSERALHANELRASVSCPHQKGNPPYDTFKRFDDCHGDEFVQCLKWLLQHPASDEIPGCEVVECESVQHEKPKPKPKPYQACNTDKCREQRRESKTHRFVVNGWNVTSKERHIHGNCLYVTVDFCYSIDCSTVITPPPDILALLNECNGTDYAKGLIWLSEHAPVHSPIKLIDDVPCNRSCDRWRAHIKAQEFTVSGWNVSITRRGKLDITVSYKNAVVVLPDGVPDLFGCDEYDFVEGLKWMLEHPASDNKAGCEYIEDAIRTKRNRSNEICSTTSCWNERYEAKAFRFTINGWNVICKERQLHDNYLYVVADHCSIDDCTIITPPSDIVALLHECNGNDFAKGLIWLSENRPEQQQQHSV